MTHGTVGNGFWEARAPWRELRLLQSQIRNESSEALTHSASSLGKGKFPAMGVLAE